MTEESKDLRQQIDELLESGSWTQASVMLATVWQQHPGPSVAAYIVSCFEQMRPHVSLMPYRLAVLRSFTVEPVVPLLRAAAFINGIDLTVHVGAFNHYAQEMLNAQSTLYQFQPDAVIFAVQTRDLLPDLWSRFPDLSPPEAERTMDQATQDLSGWVHALRSHSQAHLILHTLEMPPLPGAGIYDAQDESSQVEAIRRVNASIHSLARDHMGVYVLDYDALVARHGRVRWHDEHKWLTVRLPIKADCLMYLAQEWLRFIHPLAGKVCKALVMDLDNTLWGGVIGEDGLAGIQVGLDYPGAAYAAVQRVILDLYQRGIILAVCSKNNPADAMEAFEHHPEMLLRPHHFASMRINWQDKAQNLREIAAELNIGIEALAFLDDNPAERHWVRSELPEVTVIDLPNDPMDYSQALRDAPVFERLSLSAEDRERGRYYAEQRQRTELESSAVSLEDFYRSLQMEVEIASVTPQTLNRTAQLTQKTNQFNLTTRRYTEQQLTEMTASPEWQVRSLRVRDRFGDNGLVGVAITHCIGEVCEIDTLLLSCRVIGRTVETALLANLAQEARNQGMLSLQGWYLPTKKNVPAKDVYRSHGFKLIKEVDQDTLWEFDLSTGRINCPEWLTCSMA